MLRVLADAVGQYGVSVDTLVEGTTVLPELFGQPDGFVRESEIEQLLARTVALTGDDAFGLHWAERSSFAAFDLMGHVAAAVETFGMHSGSFFTCIPCSPTGTSSRCASKITPQSSSFISRRRPRPPPT
jgi:hypothetical protein